MIASDKKYPNKETRSYRKIVGCWDGEIVSTEEDEKEKGEVRNPASRKGDMGNPITAFLIVSTFLQLFYLLNMPGNWSWVVNLDTRHGAAPKNIDLPIYHLSFMSPFTNGHLRRLGPTVGCGIVDFNR